VRHQEYDKAVDREPNNRAGDDFGSPARRAMLASSPTPISITTRFDPP
jgi:hypothetical protein